MKLTFSLGTVPGVLLVSLAMASLTNAQTAPSPPTANFQQQINDAQSIQQPEILVTPDDNSEQFFQQDQNKLQFLPLETEPILQIHEETLKKNQHHLEKNHPQKKIQSN